MRACLSGYVLWVVLSPTRMTQSTELGAGGAPKQGAVAVDSLVVGVLPQAACADAVHADVGVARRAAARGTSSSTSVVTAGPLPGSLRIHRRLTRETRPPDRLSG